MVSERDATTESISPVRTRERRNLKAIAGSAAVVLVVLGVASFEFVNRAGHSGKPAAARHPAAPVATAHPVTASPASLATQSTSPSPSTTPPLAAQVLKPSSAAAFGPAGTADGDGKAQAGLTIDGSAGTDWRTDWYSTPHFGGLQTGTGMLLDMGKTVTVDSVQVVLGGAPGADFEIRTGNTPVLQGLTPAATESNAGGTVNAKLATPERARYVLLWFTLLPPDNAGTYQAQVDEISVSGQT